MLRTRVRQSNFIKNTYLSFLQKQFENSLLINGITREDSRIAQAVATCTAE